MRALTLLIGLLFHAQALSAQLTWEQSLLFPDEGGRMTAVALRFPAGSMNDPVGEEGSANLLGALVQELANARLVAVGGEVLVEVAEEEFLLTLLTPPEHWREGIEVLEGLLFRGDLSREGAVELDRVRGRIVDVLQFEEGSPVREFEEARSALLRGTGSPGARPPTGTVASVSRLTLEVLDRYRTTHLRRETGTVAITGPVTAAGAEATFGGPVRTVDLGGAKPLPPIPGVEETALLPAAPGGPEPPPVTLSFTPPPTVDSSPLRVPQSPGTPPAWTTPERLETDKELTSTWIAAAFPLPTGSPPLLLGFLSHLVGEALNPSPPDPGIYQMESELTWLGDRPVLVISASVDPRSAGRWEERILAILPELAESPPTGSFFDLARRRFRSALLIGLASPENRVRWAVREAARSDTASLSVEGDLWRLDREGVAGAAAAALPPRIRLIGPLGMRTP